MITQWRMNERIGVVNWHQGENHPFWGREMTEPKKTTEYAAQIIDEEIKAIISRCEKICLQRLSDHYSDLICLAESLLGHESLDGREVQQLLEKGKYIL